MGTKPHQDFAELMRFAFWSKRVENKHGRLVKLGVVKIKTRRTNQWTRGQTAVLFGYIFVFHIRLPCGFVPRYFNRSAAVPTSDVSQTKISKTF